VDEEENDVQAERERRQRYQQRQKRFYVSEERIAAFNEIAGKSFLREATDPTGNKYNEVVEVPDDIIRFAYIAFDRVVDELSHAKEYEEE
jgi:hypothetical protein